MQQSSVTQIEHMVKPKDRLSVEGTTYSSLSDHPDIYHTETAQGTINQLCRLIKRSLTIFWLLTTDDFDTFVLPNTIFGVSLAISDPNFNLSFPSSYSRLLARLVFTLYFNWSNLVIFDLANQRLPESIEEDKLNKPWRPIPTNRLSCTTARRALLAALPIVGVTSTLLGTELETTALVGLTWMYNDLHGGDENWIVRNVIIAFAFACYNVGSFKVAAGVHKLQQGELAWVVLISCVILSTMHIQDMKDQEGDSKRGRKTAPLVLGDVAARWTLALPVAIWSFVMCWFWTRGQSPVGQLGTVIASTPMVCLGLTVAIRLFRFRSKSADRTSWKLWCLWTALLYLLPAVQRVDCGWAFGRSEISSK